MSEQQQIHDPLNFMRNVWGNMGFSLPGMIAPTFDVEELDKRIKDLKAVENWLRMNLSMLQMTIQGLEMQRTTVSTVQTMSQMASDAARKMSHPAEAEAAPAAPSQSEDATAQAAGALSGAALWPWRRFAGLGGAGRLDGGFGLVLHLFAHLLHHLPGP
jgi:hypothetical protein